MMWKNSHILIPLWLDHPQFRWIKQVNKVIYAFLYNILVQYIIFSPLSLLTSCICCVIITLECPKTHSELPLTSNHPLNKHVNKKNNKVIWKRRGNYNHSVHREAAVQKSSPCLCALYTPSLQRYTQQTDASLASTYKSGKKKRNIHLRRCERYSKADKSIRSSLTGALQQPPTPDPLLTHYSHTHTPSHRWARFHPLSKWRGRMKIEGSR